jgi:cytochrome c oxidase subunit 4
MSYGGYVLIWAALVLLALGTFITSFHVHGTGEVVAALSFAAVKAFLVAWFFMHLSEEGLASRLAFLIGVLFVVLLLGFTLGDVMLRPDIPVKVPVPPW